MKNIKLLLFFLCFSVMISCQTEKWQVDLPEEADIYELSNLKSDHASIDVMEVYRHTPLMITINHGKAISYDTFDFQDDSDENSYNFSFKVISVMDSQDTEVKKTELYSCSASKETGEGIVDKTTFIGSEEPTVITYNAKFKSTHKY